VDIFLVSDATNKTRIGAHFVVFILGALLTKLGPMCLFWLSSAHFRKFDPKLWVATKNNFH
jgi:hypothetical protein